MCQKNLDRVEFVFFIFAKACLATKQAATP